MSSKKKSIIISISLAALLLASSLIIPSVAALGSSSEPVVFGELLSSPGENGTNDTTDEAAGKPEIGYLDEPYTDEALLAFEAAREFLISAGVDPEGFVYTFQISWDDRTLDETGNAYELTEFMYEIRAFEDTDSEIRVMYEIAYDYETGEFIKAGRSLAAISEDLHSYSHIRNGDYSVKIGDFCKFDIEYYAEIAELGAMTGDEAYMIVAGALSALGDNLTDYELTFAFKHPAGVDGYPNPCWMIVIDNRLKMRNTDDTIAFTALVDAIDGSILSCKRIDELTKAEAADPADTDSVVVDPVVTDPVVTDPALTPDAAVRDAEYYLHRVKDMMTGAGFNTEDYVYDVTNENSTFATIAGELTKRDEVLMEIARRGYKLSSLGGDSAIFEAVCDELGYIPSESILPSESWQIKVYEKTTCNIPNAMVETFDFIFYPATNELAYGIHGFGIFSEEGSKISAVNYFTSDGEFVAYPAEFYELFVPSTCITGKQAADIALKALEEAGKDLTGYTDGYEYSKPAYFERYDISEGGGNYFVTVFDVDAARSGEEAVGYCVIVDSNDGSVIEVKEQYTFYYKIAEW